MTGAAPLDAALVTPDFGWVLTPDQLLVTHDGGTSFTPVSVPVPAGTVRAVQFRDDQNGVAAAASGTGVTVARTSDGGRTWRSQAIRDTAASPAGYSGVAVSFGDAANGAILARTATSPAFSVGTLFATTDGGVSWAARRAPEAGQVTVDPGGRTWLAGDALDVTTDQGRSWTRARLQLAVTGGAVTVSTPVGGKLPVTVVAGGQTEVEVLTTADGGRTWGQASRVRVRARTGPGARVPVAGTASGLVVFDTVAGHAYRAGSGVEIGPSGLPDGVDAVSFASGGQTGWALAVYGTCAHGKQACVLHHDLVGSTDGGLTWQTLAVWTQTAG
jgi:hypothetical protein